jgi:hypothetical protein
VIAVVIAMIGSLLFSWYVANFGSYNETYGSLGAIIGFMTWLWIMAAFIITGGEINAEMEHQTKRDTTTGAEQPLGTRGAEMADHVAQGPHDTGKDDARGAAHASGARNASHASGTANDGSGRYPAREDDLQTAQARAFGGRGPAAARTTRAARSREPLDATGAVMLLGAIVLAMAAGKSPGGSAGRGPERGPAQRPVPPRQARQPQYPDYPSYST